jgi:hypothetical protein
MVHNLVILILTFILGGILFAKIRSKILQRFKNTIKEISGSNVTAKVKEVRESFNWRKFSKTFALFDPIEWIKSLKEIGILDVRKWIMIGIIVGIVFSYGWYQGKQGKDVKFMNFKYEEEFHVKLYEYFLHKPKNSHNLLVADEHGNTLKTIAVKDIPELKKALRPIGFQLQPILVTGYGVSDFGNGGVEVGAGASFLKYWKGRLEAFLTQRGIYLGTSYMITDNSGLGLGAGKGYHGDNRAMIYFRTKF